ncbi:MAG: HEAT repeat domain-containing protein, partial [Candidatus Methanofastidiosia archaeon]
FRYFTTLGKDDPEVKKEFFGLLRDEDWYIRWGAAKYFTTLGIDDPEVKEEFFRLLSDQMRLPSSNKTIQDIAVEFLSQFAREESLERASILFISKDWHIERGAYKLMKALIHS